MTNNKPKYNITVKLTGKDGNAFNLISIVLNELKKQGVSQNDRDLIFKDFTSSGSYDELLEKFSSYVNVK